MLRPSRVLSALLGLTAAAAPCRAGTAPTTSILYGLLSSSPGTLYSIDTRTGFATSLVSLPKPSFFGGGGLGFHGGKLYASDEFTGFGRSQQLNFGSIDVATGQFTPINDQGGDPGWDGLALNPGGGFFYTADTVTETLLAVTPSGSFKPIGAVGALGPFGQAFDSLAYDSISRTLYGIGGLGVADNLYKIDTTTGKPTLIGPTGLTPDSLLYGLAFDPISDTLYLNEGHFFRQTDSDYNSLYTVNTDTAAVTLVGSNGTVAGYGIQSIAFAPVPEPSSAELLLLIGVLLRRH